jgi:hypothetical protein
MVHIKQQLKFVNKSLRHSLNELNIYNGHQHPAVLAIASYANTLSVCTKKDSPYGLSLPGCRKALFNAGCYPGQRGFLFGYPFTTEEKIQIKKQHDTEVNTKAANACT